VVMVLLAYAWLKGSVSISGEGKWICIGFLICFLALPFKLFGSKMADIRVITAAFLIIPAFLTFTSNRTSQGYLIAFGVIATAAVNIIYVSYVWFSYRSDYDAIKASFMLLRQNSFVLVASSARSDPSMLLTDAPMARAPTLAVYYAKAFVTSL